MAKGYKLYALCPACHGKGTRTIYGAAGGTSSITCIECGGDGIVFSGWCTEALYDMPDITADPMNESGD